MQKAGCNKQCTVFTDTVKSVLTAPPPVILLAAIHTGGSPGLGRWQSRIRQVWLQASGDYFLNGNMSPQDSAGNEIGEVHMPRSQTYIDGLDVREEDTKALVKHEVTWTDHDDVQGSVRDDMPHYSPYLILSKELAGV